jgi:hypothetical protein
MTLWWVNEESSSQADRSSVLQSLGL